MKNKKTKFYVLGIESTAHTFGISIVDEDYNILANERIAFSSEEGGMIPSKVADFHVQNVDKVIKKALEKSGVKLKDISLIAYSKAPGIGQCLKIGCVVAKNLGLKLGVKLVPVNHCIAHLEVGRILTKAKDPVLLYASGANTQIIAYEGGKYRIFGETLDIGIGNFLDSFGRALGLGFPAGPKIEKLAKMSNNYIELPYSVKGMDISLGGLLTNLKQKIEEGYKKEDLCYSAQETVFAMLIEVSERAMAHCQKNELLLGGGVACNKRLQEMAHIMTKERGAKMFVLKNQFLIDNAAMIALTGLLMYKKGNIFIEPKDAFYDPYERTDDVKVTWR